MRRVVFSLVSCAAGLALLSAADVTVMEEIIAKVNGDIVTRGELDKGRAAIADDLQRRGAKGQAVEDGVKEREKDILRERIDQLLLVQKGKELNINVDGEISKQLAELQKQANIADPEKFQAYLKEQTGMSYEDYKSEMRNGMLTQRVIRQEVGGRINIPRAEIRKYYDEHKTEFVREDRVFLSEIFISTQGKDPAGVAASEKKAKDLVARAKKGEKFPELAKDNSDSQSAQNFGELGAFKKEDLKKEIIDLVWEQQRGFLTDPPIKSENGFLILRVDERHRPGQAEFEEVENVITEKLYMPVFQPKVREYLTQLRQDAFLEIKDGYLDTAAAPGKSTRWTDPAQLKPETVSKNEVANQKKRKRLLWAVPLPGTQKKSKSSSKDTQ
ncbi:MAG: peptidylprolyl isomerase [Bryobacteraceae bacterium]